MRADGGRGQRRPLVAVVFPDPFGRLNVAWVQILWWRLKQGFEMVIHILEYTIETVGTYI